MRSFVAEFSFQALEVLYRRPRLK